MSAWNEWGKAAVTTQQPAAAAATHTPAGKQGSSSKWGGLIDGSLTLAPSPAASHPWEEASPPREEASPPAPSTSTTTQLHTLTQRIVKLEAENGALLRGRKEDAATIARLQKEVEQGKVRGVPAGASGAPRHSRSPGGGGALEGGGRTAAMKQELRRALAALQVEHSTALEELRGEYAGRLAEHRSRIDALTVENAQLKGGEEHEQPSPGKHYPSEAARPRAATVTPDQEWGTSQSRSTELLPSRQHFEYSPQSTATTDVSQSWRISELPNTAVKDSPVFKSHHASASSISAPHHHASFASPTTHAYSEAPEMEFTHTPHTERAHRRAHTERRRRERETESSPLSGDGKDRAHSAHRKRTFSPPDIGSPVFGGEWGSRQDSMLSSQSRSKYIIAPPKSPSRSISPAEHSVASAWPDMGSTRQRSHLTQSTQHTTHIQPPIPSEPTTTTTTTTESSSFPKIAVPSLSGRASSRSRGGGGGGGGGGPPPTSSSRSPRGSANGWVMDAPYVPPLPLSIVKRGRAPERASESFQSLPLPRSASGVRGVGSEGGVVTTHRGGSAQSRQDSQRRVRLPSPLQGSSPRDTFAGEHKFSPRSQTSLGSARSTLSHPQYIKSPVAAPAKSPRESPRKESPRIPPPKAVSVRGARVTRNMKSWKWGDQDGGPGTLGTALVEEEGWVTVLWDKTGKKNSYRWGHMGVYDVTPVAAAAVGGAPGGDGVLATHGKNPALGQRTPRGGEADAAHDVSLSSNGL